MEPSKFDISPKARRLRGQKENLKGSICRPFNYIKHCPFFRSQDPTAFIFRHLSIVTFYHLTTFIIPSKVKSLLHHFCQSGPHNICKSRSHDAKVFGASSGAHFCWLHCLFIFWCCICLCSLSVVSFVVVSILGVCFWSCT
jgi:hypothetical protein